MDGCIEGQSGNIVGKLERLTIMTILFAECIFYVVSLNAVSTTIYFILKTLNNLFKLCASQLQKLASYNITLLMQYIKLIAQIQKW